MAESFFSSLECELLAHRQFTSQARGAVRATPAWPASATSRVGTTPSGFTPPWVIARQRPTSRRIRQRSQRTRNHPRPSTVHRTGAIPHLGLEQAVDGLGQGIVVAVADAADRGLDARLGEALGAAQRKVLRSPVRMVYEAVVPNGTALVQGPWRRARHASASSTKLAWAVRDTRQPTIRRAKASMSGEPLGSTTNATYTNPDQVRPKAGQTEVATWVKSLTHNAFGRGALNWRFTRSSGQAVAGSGTVVRTFLPRTTPCSPMARIRRTTVQRATTRPSRASCRPWRARRHACAPRRP